MSQINHNPKLYEAIEDKRISALSDIEIQAENELESIKKSAAQLEGLFSAILNLSK